MRTLRYLRTKRAKKKIELCMGSVALDTLQLLVAVAALLLTTQQALLELSDKTLPLVLVQRVAVQVRDKVLEHFEVLQDIGTVVFKFHPLSRERSLPISLNTRSPLFGCKPRLWLRIWRWGWLNREPL